MVDLQSGQVTALPGGIVKQNDLGYKADRRNPGRGSNPIGGTQKSAILWRIFNISAQRFGSGSGGAGETHIIFAPLLETRC
jgi:hypothetical protein